MSVGDRSPAGPSSSRVRGARRPGRVADAAPTRTGRAAGRWRRRRASGSRRRPARPARSTEPIGRRSTVAVMCRSRRAVEPAASGASQSGGWLVAGRSARSATPPPACRAGRGRWRPPRPRTATPDRAVRTSAMAAPPSSRRRRSAVPPCSRRAIPKPLNRLVASSASSHGRRPRATAAGSASRAPGAGSTTPAIDGTRHRSASDAEPDHRREGARRRGRPAARSTPASAMAIGVMAVSPTRGRTGRPADRRAGRGRPRPTSTTTRATAISRSSNVRTRMRPSLAAARHVAASTGWAMTAGSSPRDPTGRGHARTAPDRPSGGTRDRGNVGHGRPGTARVTGTRAIVSPRLVLASPRRAPRASLDPPLPRSRTSAATEGPARQAGPASTYRLLKGLDAG